MRFLLASAILTLGTVVAAPIPKELRTVGDAKAIAGTWVGTGSDKVRFRFLADGTLHTWYGEREQGRMGWTWAITDQKATPKRARINRAENPAAGYDCVYELTGDTLKFALILNANGVVPPAVVPQPGLEYHAMTRESAGK